MTTPLTVEDLDTVITLVNARLGADHPVALPPEGREPLAYCLECATKAHAGWQLPQVERTAARVYWSIIQIRPLPDGNKRVAMVATALFLLRNGYLPLWSPEMMYDLATLRSDDYVNEDPTLEDLALLISTNIRPLTEYDIHGAAIVAAA